MAPTVPARDCKATFSLKVKSSKIFRNSSTCCLLWLDLIVNELVSQSSSSDVKKP